MSDTPETTVEATVADAVATPELVTERAAAQAPKVVLSFSTRRVVAEAQVRGTIAGVRANLLTDRETRLQRHALRLAEKAANAHIDAETYRAQQADQQARAQAARDLEAQHNQAAAERRAIHDAEIARLNDQYATLRAAKAAEVSDANGEVSRIVAELRTARDAAKARTAEHGALVVEQRTAIAAARIAHGADAKAATSDHQAAVRRVVREGVAVGE